MLSNAQLFSSFSTDDLEASKKFYSEILGLEVKENEMSILEITGNSHRFIIYPKGEDHQPANFTVLNFEVSNLEQTVDELISKGITFEQYGGSMQTDEKGIARSDEGPAIAWFKDPAGNILSLIEI